MTRQWSLIRFGFVFTAMFAAATVLWATAGHSGDFMGNDTFSRMDTEDGSALVATLMPKGRPGAPTNGGVIIGRNLTDAKRCRDQLLNNNDEMDTRWIEDCVQLVSRFEGAGGGKIIIVKMKSGTDGRHSFEPAKVNINRGDTVRWVLDSGAHGSEAYPDHIPEGTTPWDLPLLSRIGDSYARSYFISGTYQYHCHPHKKEGMLGVIFVERESGPTETRSATEKEMTRAHH